MARPEKTKQDLRSEATSQRLVAAAVGRELHLVAVGRDAHGLALAGDDRVALLSRNLAHVVGVEELKRAHPNV